MNTRYGISKTTSLSPADAAAAIRESLSDVGFGILTEIDVAATLKTKLDVDRAPYKILGACNPSLAAHALDTEESIGLLLPCNVVIYEAGAGDTVVAALQPDTMVELTDNESLADIAGQARAALEKALATIPS